MNTLDEAPDIIGGGHGQLGLTALLDSPMILRADRKTEAAPATRR